MKFPLLNPTTSKTDLLPVIEIRDKKSGHFVKNKIYYYATFITLKLFNRAVFDFIYFYIL